MYDWEDSVPQIYAEVTGQALSGTTDGQGPFTGREKALLMSLATDHQLPDELVLRLVDLERQMYGMVRRTTMQSKIDQILGEDWRSRDEVLRSAVTLRSDNESATSGEV
jgi:DNA sulfur modification protein DndC